MGWTAHYQLLRDRPLVDEEARALAQWVARVNEKPWECEPFDLRLTTAARADRVIAFGMTKLAMNLDASPDADRLAKTLAELRKLAGAELRVEDDVNLFEGDGPTVELVDRSGFVAARTLAPPPGPKLPKKLAAALDKGDRAAIAREGLSRWVKLHRTWEVWRPIADAMKTVEDVSELVPIFLELWRNPKSLYWFGDLRQSLSNEFLARLARDPAVMAELLANLAWAESSLKSDDERSFRRADVAAKLLAQGGSDEGIDALLGIIRRLRGVELPTNPRFHLYHAANDALAAHPQPRCFATVLLHRGASEWTQPVGHDNALYTLDAARARPVLLRLAALGIVERWLLDALDGYGDDESRAQLRALMRDPRRPIREHAAQLLGEPNEMDDPPPEELMVHPHDQVRQAALRALHARKDRSLFVSLAAGDWLDEMLFCRTGPRHGLPFSWADWREILPGVAMHKMRLRQRIEWAREEGAAIVGEQTILPAIAPVLERGADAVAAEYPTGRFRLEADEIAALLDEEERALGRR